MVAGQPNKRTWMHTAWTLLLRWPWSCVRHSPVCRRQRPSLGQRGQAPHRQPVQQKRGDITDAMKAYCPLSDEVAIPTTLTVQLGTKWSVWNDHPALNDDNTLARDKEVERDRDVCAVRGISASVPRSSLRHLQSPPCAESCPSAAAATAPPCAHSARDDPHSRPRCSWWVPPRAMCWARASSRGRHRQRRRTGWTAP
jgi:hypothetical protein